MPLFQTSCPLRTIHSLMPSLFRFKAMWARGNMASKARNVLLSLNSMMKQIGRKNVCSLGFLFQYQYYVVYKLNCICSKRKSRLCHKGFSFLGCPRLHLNHMTKLAVCPIELHRVKVNGFFFYFGIRKLANMDPTFFG